MNDRTRLVGDLVRLGRRAPRRRPDHDWLYGGARPRLSDIEAGAGVPADDLAALTILVTRQTSPQGLHLIAGPAGSGRSTLLLQLGRELARDGYPVYLYAPGDAGATLDRVLAAARRPPLTYLLIDDLDLCPEAETMLYEIARAGAKILVIGTVRTELPQAHDGDGLAELRPATLIDSGARQSLRPRVQGPQWGLQPRGDWRPQALAEAAASEAFLGLVLAGLAELPVPSSVLAASADGKRVATWLRNHLAGSGGTVVFPPHSETCRDLLRALQPAASQMEAALSLLLDHAVGKQAVFAPQLLARLALAPETAEVARGQIARRGEAAMQGVATDAVSLAWQLAWQVAAPGPTELPGANGYPPDKARRLRSCFAAGQFNAAMELAASLTEDPWYGALGQYDVSLLRARRGEWQLASTAAAQANPALPQTSFLLALLAEKRHDFDAAIDYYKVAVEDPTLAISAAYHLGQLYLGMGAPRTALRLFEAALQEDPIHPWPYGGAAVAHLQLGAPEAATAQSTRAIRAGVPPVQARRAVARGFLLARSYGYAVAELERCVAEAPDEMEAWRDLAEAAHQAGDYAREQEALEQIIALAPDDVAARVQMARATMDRGNAQAAWQMLTALSEAALSTVPGSLLTAEVAGRVNRPREQYRAAEAALTRGDTSGWALLWLGCSEAALGGPPDEAFARAAAALHRGLETDLPPRERARLWEAILVTALALRDEIAVEQATINARQEAQLCAATAAKIESVIAGQAVGASAFQRQLEALREHGPEGMLWQLAPPTALEEPPPAPAELEPIAAPLVGPTAVELPSEVEPEAEPMLEPEPEPVVEPEAAVVEELAVVEAPAVVEEPVVVEEPLVVAQPEPEPEPVAEPEPVREAVAVVVSPQQARILSAGDSVQFAAVLQYDDGTSEDVTDQATWAWTGGRQAGAVGGTGLFTAGDDFGAGRITATYGDFAAESEELTVRNVAVLTLAPSETATLSDGDTIQFVAVLQYDDGTSEDVTARAAWVWSGDERAGAVSETGLFTAGAGYGAGQVIVTYGDFAAESEELTVRTVAVLTLAPSAAAVLSAGEAIQFAAVWQYNDGTTEDVTTQAAWAWTGDERAGAVSVAGLFTAGEGYGAGRVTATSGEFSAATEQLVVRNVAVLALAPPEAATLSAGDTIQFTATLQYDDGTSEDVTAQAAWTWTGDEQAGAVNEAGLFSAGHGFGVGRVTAVFGELTSQSADLIVRNVAVLTLAPPAAATLSVGDTIQFTVTLQYNDGTSEDVTDQAAWTWSGGEPVGAISPTGLFTAGRGFGVGKVTAACGDLTAESEELTVRNVAVLTLAPSAAAVLSAGEAIQFAAVLQYDDGATEDVTDRAIWIWSGDGEAGAVGEAGLFVAGQSFGVGQVTAAYGAFAAESEDVTVRNVAVLTLTPSEVAILSGGDTIQFTAVLRYNDETTEDVTAQTLWAWTGDGQAGTVSETGLFAAGEGRGVGQVTATCGELSAASGDLTVRNVVALALSPFEAQLLSAGDTIQFAAILQYNDGTTADVTDRATWSWSGDEQAGAISPTGLFTAGEGFGAGRITASDGDFAAESEALTIRNVAVLTLIPSESAVLSGGDAIQFAATLQYNDDTTEDVTTQAAWTWSGNERAGAVSETGLFTAGAGFGVGRIAAAFGELTAISGDLTVRNVALLTLAPSEVAVLSAGDTIQFAAAFQYNDDTTEDVTDRAVWTWSGDEQAGAVSGAGLFTVGEGFGLGRVTASYGDFAAESDALTIRNVAVLTLTPSQPAVLSAGDTIQFAAVLQYDDGSTEDVTAQALWAWTGDEQAGTVTQAGLFIASDGFGVGRITATLGELTAESDDVSIRSVAAFTLTPSEAGVLAAGDAIQFAATLQYNDGAGEDVTDQAIWGWTGDEQAGAVNEAGLFIAGAGFGGGRVTAVLDELVSESAELTVRNVAVLALTPPEVAVLSAGDTIQFAAALQYNDDTTEDVTDRAVWTWSGDEQAGAVSGAGLFTVGEGFGLGRVTASYGEFVAESEALTIRNVAVLTLTPLQPAVLSAGDTIQFAAVLQYDDGSTEDVTAQAAWTWTGQGEAGSVSGVGLFGAGEGFGAGQVTATHEGFTAASADLTVRHVTVLALTPTEAAILSVGETIRFSAALEYDDGTSEDVTDRATWAWTGDERAGAVGEAGHFTAGDGFGAGRVTAVHGDFTAESEELTVRNVTVLSLGPSEPASLSAGETVQFSAVLQYDDGTSEDVTEQATWTWSGAAEAGTVSATGLFTAEGGFGAGRVMAADGDFIAESGMLTVRNVAVLTLTPTEAVVLSAGDAIQFAATLQYNDGVTQDVTAQAVWSWTGDERAGTITEAGLFTAGDGFGVGQVTATWGDFTAGSEDLTIRSVARLTLTPSWPTILSAADSVQFAAVLQYNDGATEEVTGRAVWTWSGDEQAGAVSETGLFTAGDGFGAGRVTAVQGDFTADSQEITVRHVAALVLSPVAEVILEPGETARFAAAVQYNDGTSEDVTHQATWSWTGYEQSGLIREPGLFVAGEESGVGQVEAVWGDGRATSAPVTVEGVSNLAVLPSADLRVELGQVQRFSALMRDADDAWAHVPAGVEWSWTGPAECGQMDADGVFTAGPEPGEGTVVATHEGRRARSGLVLARPAAQFVLLPAEPVMLTAGQAVQCRAVLRYATGEEEDVSDRAAWRWDGDEAAGVISAEGMFTASEVCASGNLVATFEGLEAPSEAITVYSIECLVVLPSSELYLGPGETQRFSASFRYGDGTLGDATNTVEWAWTGPPESGSIAPDGMFTAGSVVGEGVVTASFGGHRDQSGRLMVRGVTRLVLSPDGEEVLWQDDSRQFTLIAEYSDGHTEDVTAEATWSWMGPGGSGEVFRRGQFTHSGRWCGPTTVTAIYRDQTATSGTIHLRNLVTLRLFPVEELTLGPGETKQFRLYAVCEPEKAAKTGMLGGLFQRGAKAKEELVEITAEAEWHWTGDPAAAALSDTGLFAVGESYDVGRITATFRNLRVHSSAITVTAPVSAETAPREVDPQALRERLARVISEARSDSNDPPPPA